MNYQEFLSSKFPFFARFFREFRLKQLSKKSTQEVFTDIYVKNTWKSTESVSGLGSTMEHTRTIRKELPQLVNDFKINTFLDLPCGDFNWMKEVSLPVAKYIGGDIVADIIRRNNSKYATNIISFVQLNLIESELPDADVLFCRDCLVHLSFKDIGKGIRNIKSSKIIYLLTTTFPNIDASEDIITGRWRRLNLQKPPFNYPTPVILIEENGRTDIDRKCLGLWLVSDINAPQ